ncbi:MAG: WG repeat-containing protein [Oscillospiraceae bacterium]
MLIINKNQQKKNNLNKNNKDNLNKKQSFKRLIDNKTEYVTYDNYDAKTEKNQAESNPSKVLSGASIDGYKKYEDYNTTLLQENNQENDLLINENSQYTTFDQIEKGKTLQTDSDKKSDDNIIKEGFISYDDFIETSQYGETLLKSTVESGNNTKSYVKEFKEVDSKTKENLIAQAEKEGKLSIKQKKMKKSLKILLACVSFCLIGVITLFTTLSVIEKEKEKPFTLQNFSHNLIPFKSGDKWGFVDSQGNEKLPPIYELAEPFAKNGLALVYFNSKYNYININGEFLTEKGFSKASSFDDSNLAAIVESTRLGFINSKGDLVISTLYNDEKPFNFNQNTIVTENNFFGNNGLAPVKTNDGLALIDQSGISTYSSEHIQVATAFVNDFSIVRKQGKFGYIDSKGKEVIPCIYESAMPFGKNGKAVVLAGAFYNIIDRNGKVLFTIDKTETNINQLFYYTWCDNVNLLPIIKNGKYGFTNFTYEEIIEYKYDYATPFMKNGLALVLENGRIDIIDTHGTSQLKSIVKYQGDSNSLIQCVMANNGQYIPFINSDNGKYGFLNNEGNVVIEPQFDTVSAFDLNGYSIVSKDDLYGMINTKGEVIINFKYDMLRNVIKLK